MWEVEHTTLTIPTSAIVSGENIIAAELHKNYAAYETASFALILSLSVTALSAASATATPTVRGPTWRSSLESSSWDLQKVTHP